MHPETGKAMYRIDNENHKLELKDSIIFPGEYLSSDFVDSGITPAASWIKSGLAGGEV